jgi:predicted transcriptional regulator
MEFMETSANQAELLNVLVVGNNPIELSKTFESLSQIKHSTRYSLRLPLISQAYHRKPRSFQAALHFN